jgi:hypothetical protein
MSEAANILIEELKSHSTGWIILCETPLESVLTIELDAIKLLTDEDYNVLVLSASRPYPNSAHQLPSNYGCTPRVLCVLAALAIHGSDQPTLRARAQAPSLRNGSRRSLP